MISFTAADSGQFAGWKKVMKLSSDSNHFYVIFIAVLTWDLDYDRKITY
jgi:hypothetical protein